MADYFWYLDSSKAARELGFAPRDPQETLLDTVNYVRENFLGGAAFTNAGDEGSNRLRSGVSNHGDARHAGRCIGSRSAVPSVYPCSLLAPICSSAAPDAQRARQDFELAGRRPASSPSNSNFTLHRRDAARPRQARARVLTSLQAEVRAEVDAVGVGENGERAHVADGDDVEAGRRRASPSGAIFMPPPK